MRTVFINGLMPDRSRAFIRALCREFQVVGTGYGMLNDDPEIMVHEPADLIGAFEFAGDEDFLRNIVSQAKILSESLQRDVLSSPLGPPEGWSLSKDKQSQMILPKVAHLLHQVRMFENFHSHQPVHMLISGSDYSSHSRPIVLAARDLGVPTLNIEHGFFFSMMLSEFKEPQGRIPILFSSQYVNLDNSLEVAVMTDHLHEFPTVSPTLLDLGTPALTVAHEAPDLETARQNLELHGDRKKILLLGSWIEARMAGSLISGQLDTINLFSNLFSSLARSTVRDQMDLLIKLHPADCTRQVLPHVSACLKDLAEKAGLPAPIIYADRLADVLSAADVVLAISWTSVLWDAFLLNKPAVVVLPDYLTQTFKPGWREKGNVPLTEGVVRAAESPDEAWKIIEGFMEPGYKKIHANKCLQVRNKYNITDKSVDQKSKDITQWIVDFPDSPGADIG